MNKHKKKGGFTINPDNKFYPRHHMWTYCTFLGKYVDSIGNKFDLGILIRESYPDQLCNATVWGNKPWEYSSGYINTNVLDIPYEEWLKKWSNQMDCKYMRRKWLYDREIVKRAKALNIVLKPEDKLVW